MTKIVIAVVATLLMGFTFASAQVNRNDALDPLALAAFPELAKLMEDVAPAVKAVAREEAVRAAMKATQGRARVSSTDRGKTHELPSKAHDRGAIDLSNVTLEDAQPVSLEAGPDPTVIYEQPGPEADTHTSYRAGNVISIGGGLLS